jgi:hypothetical protein
VGCSAQHHNGLLTVTIIRAMATKWQCTTCGETVNTGDSHGCGGNLDGLILAELRAIREALTSESQTVASEQSLLSKFTSMFKGS